MNQRPPYSAPSSLSGEIVAGVSEQLLRGPACECVTLRVRLCSPNVQERGLREVSPDRARKADTQGGSGVHDSRGGPCAARNDTDGTSRQHCGAASSSASPLSHCPSVPYSQAIRELQEEVARLRLRLEDSLHPPAPGSPTRPASAFNRPARARARPAEASAPWGPHCGRWVTPNARPCALVKAQKLDLASLGGSPQTCGLRHSHTPVSLIHSIIHSFTPSFTHSDMVLLCNI